MSSLDSLGRDLRVALRVLWKNPGATALSVLSIALGLGLTAGIFGFVDAYVLRPMPFHQPERVFQVYSLGDDGRIMGYGWADYLDIAAAGAGLGEFASSQRRGLMMAAGDETEMVLAVPISPNYFSLLGVRALLGRATVDTAAGRHQAVLGYHLWRRRFGGDPNIVGKTVIMSGQPLMVAGVMPEEFTGIDRGSATDVWLSEEAWLVRDPAERQARYGDIDIIARLRSGVTPERAAAPIEAVLRAAGKHKPAPAGAVGTSLTARFAPNWRSEVLFGGGFALALSMVLFVACANVAQLRLAQAEGRKKEFGVRMAVGAGGWQVVRQLLVESALISIAGGGLGLLLAHGLMAKVAQFVAIVDPSVDLGLRLDARVLAFAAFALLLSVVLSGLAPARHAVSLDVARILKSEQGSTGVRRNWGRQLLAAGQVGVTVALFGLAALFLASLRTAAAIRPGLDPQKRLFVMAVSPGDHTDLAGWSEHARESLAAVPGVRAVTYARRLPLSGSGGGMTARVEIPGQSPFSVHLNNVGGNYFGLAGTRVLAGRGIEPGDRAGGTLVAVINQTFARQVLPGRNPVGEWVRIRGKLRQIVGVAEDGPSNDLHELPEPFVWLPYSQSPTDDVTLMVETAGEPDDLGRTLRAELRRFDPQVVIIESQSLRHQIETALAPDRLAASVAEGLGVFGILFTAAGLFGVLQYAVSRRTRELGLRMALGARPAAIQRMVLGESLRLAASGIPFGLVLLAAGSWSVRSWLLGIAPLNPMLYVASAATALVLTIAAAWLPALRATRVDPVEALRSE